MWPRSATRVIETSRPARPRVRGALALIVIALTLSCQPASHDGGHGGTAADPNAPVRGDDPLDIAAVYAPDAPIQPETPLFVLSTEIDETPSPVRAHLSGWPAGQQVQLVRENDGHEFAVTVDAAGNAVETFAWSDFPLTMRASGGGQTRTDVLDAAGDAVVRMRWTCVGSEPRVKAFFSGWPAAGLIAAYREQDRSLSAQETDSRGQSTTIFSWFGPLDLTAASGNRRVSSTLDTLETNLCGR